MQGRAAGEATRARIIASIRTLTTEYRRPPTVREIGAHVAIGSTGHLSYHLRVLEQEGALTHLPGTSRGVMLAPDLRAGSAPLGRRLPRTTLPLRGRIAAGEPIEAVEEREATLDLEGMLAPRGEDLFALRVTGTSMIEDLIADGDVVVVRPQETVRDGETVVALLLNGSAPAGEVTLKRFYREPGGRIRLQPANSAMEPLIVDAREVQVQGTVVAVLRDV